MGVGRMRGTGDNPAAPQISLPEVTPILTLTPQPAPDPSPASTGTEINPAEKGFPALNSR